MLAQYDSDNCVILPHTCPYGFTLAFYTKLNDATKVGKQLVFKQKPQILALYFHFLLYLDHMMSVEMMLNLSGCWNIVLSTLLIQLVSGATTVL